MTTQASTPAVRFALPDIPGPVAAWRVAMAQASARQNAQSFIENMLRLLDKAGVDQDTRRELRDHAGHMLLDAAIEPCEILTSSRSCLSQELIWADEDDAVAVDEIYGAGFTAALCASVPASYPRPQGTLWPGDPGWDEPPANYAGPEGEWADAVNAGVFGGGPQRPSAFALRGSR